MRILMISPHFAEYTLCHAVALSNLGHEVLLMLNAVNVKNELGVLSRVSLPPRLTIKALPHEASVKVLIGNVVEYLKSYSEFKPEIIHLQEEPKDYVIGFLALARKTPVVLTVHDPKPHAGHDLNSQKFSRYRLYRQYMRRRANGIVVHGRDFVAELQEACPYAKIAVGPHGPLGMFSEVACSPTPQSGRCLFFGRIQEYKGLGVFIDAIKRLRLTKPDAKGVIAGRGPDLDRWRDSICGDDGFELIEKFLSPTEVIEQFDLAQVVVLPYLEASQSGVAAYALGRGRPLVVTNVGTLPECVEDGISGYVVPVNEPHRLSEAIRSILDSESLSIDFGQRAIEISQGRQSWLSMAESSESLYVELLGLQQ